MKYANWAVPEFDRQSAAHLCKCGVNPLVSVILVSRGIKEKEEIEKLTSNDASLISDPFLLKDMDKAVSRIERAIKDNEHIAVYGDYDVDGITSSTLLSGYFRKRGLKCETFIPERLTDGYGVKSDALTRLKALGVTLVVTVDCGITATQEAKYAKELGLDLIITDHHKCSENIPDAVAVVDPTRLDDSYPFKSLAGVGVAFKLICALEKDTPIEELLTSYSGITALGTIADVMPVTYENRVIIKHGLESLKSGRSVGIKALCESAGINPNQISVSNLGYILAPRLNAAGRLGETHFATELLCESDEDKAHILAEELCKLNRDRQQLEMSLIDDAVSYLDKHPNNGAPIVIASKDWHQGVAGIAASRLAEKYHVPAIVICLSEGIGRGSCRTFGGFNIFSALGHCSDLLMGFGGHDMAAGLTIEEENIPKFAEKLGEYYKTADKEFEPTLNIDYEVTKPGLLTIENICALDSLEPYGNGNPSPLLCIKDAYVTSVYPIGGGKHTKFNILKNGENFECICFSASAEMLGIEPGIKADIAFMPQISNFRGRQTVQLLISDVKTQK